MDDQFKHPIYDVAERTQWQGPTHQRRRGYRRMISLSHHLTFMLGRWFPKAFPLLYIVGYPKSATTWICQLAADYWQLPFPQHSILPIGFASVIQGHESIDKKFPAGVYVVRDGRDVVISSFHHLRSQFVAGGGKRMHKRYFQSIDLERPLIDLLPGFIEHSVKCPVSCRLNWGDHVKSYYQSKNPNVVISRYEDMLHDPHAALASLVQRLSGVEADPARVSQAIERCSFKARTSVKNKKQGEASYYRKGQKGDWRNYFTRDAAALFDQHFGESLVLAGYETDSDWVASVTDPELQRQDAGEPDPSTTSQRDEVALDAAAGDSSLGDPSSAKSQVPS